MFPVREESADDNNIVVNPSTTPQTAAIPRAEEIGPTQEARSMAIDVTGMLRKVLADLEAERQRVDHRIMAVRRALDSTGAPARTRKPLSAAARRALSRRMKAYWAKRRAK